MTEQVITIDLNGSLESLRQKKGQGVDLREFGAVQMERVSEINMNETTQKYYVSFLLGLLAGRNLSQGLYHTLKEDDAFLAHSRERQYFDEYEDAVEAEIFVLNAFRKNDEIVSTATLDLICPKSR